MKARLLVSAVGVPLLLGVVLFAPPWVTVVFVVALSVIACHELLHAVGGQQWKQFYGVLLLAGINAALFSTDAMAFVGYAILLTVVLAFVTAIFRYGTAQQIHFSVLMAALFGALAIPASFSCISQLRYTSPVLTLTPFVAAFCSDSLALFAGMTFGKHKLAPHVSPKKTVEGSIGGFLGAVIGMVLFSLIARATVFLFLGWDVIVVMGLLGSLMGQLGDLSFSVIKREFGVKDYGKLMPGHGGVLDRFDSVLFVAPVFWLYLCSHF